MHALTPSCIAVLRKMNDIKHIEIAVYGIYICTNCFLVCVCMCVCASVCAQARCTRSEVGAASDGRGNLPGEGAGGGHT